MTDVRHLGRYAIYEYVCPQCGIVLSVFEPDYPYTAPPVNYICHHCAAVTKLISGEPIF